MIYLWMKMFHGKVLDYQTILQRMTKTITISSPPGLGIPFWTDNSWFENVWNPPDLAVAGVHRMKNHPFTQIYDVNTVFPKTFDDWNPRIFDGSRSISTRSHNFSNGDVHGVFLAKKSPVELFKSSFFVGWIAILRFVVWSCHVCWLPSGYLT